MEALCLVYAENGERMAKTTEGRADAPEIWGGAHLAALAAQSWAADTYDDVDNLVNSERHLALADDAEANTAAALRAATRGVWDL